MGRSSGYRPRKEAAEQVNALRAELATLDSSKWQKANMIMDNITMLCGKSMGPSNGRINARACKFCNYYGHTRQHCPKRARIEGDHTKSIISENDFLREQLRTFVPPPPYDPLKSLEALGFDADRIPYTLCPYVGPIVGLPGENHAGKWTYGDNGLIISRAASAD